MIARVARDDWYRAGSWDDDTAQAFERRLARARATSRAQYLKIQGVHLTESAQLSDREAGRELLRRAVDEDLDETKFEAAGAWQILGSSLARDGRWDEAATAMRECVRLCTSRRIGTSGTSGTAQLDLAEILTRIGGPEHVAEAVDLLADVEETVREQSFLAVVQFRFNLVCARAAARRQNPVAGTYARRALELAERGTPTVARHPQLGRVEIGPVTRGELEELSTTYPNDQPVQDARHALHTAH
jgi:hypothetical protein